MCGYLPKNELIFFIPGKSGVVFTHPANHFISAEQLIRSQENLMEETAHPIVYVEERRKKSRRSQDVFLCQAERG